MQINRASRNAFGCLLRPLIVTLLLIAGFTNVGRAAGYASSELAKAHLSNAADTRGMVNS